MQQLLLCRSGLAADGAVNQPVGHPDQAEGDQDSAGYVDSSRRGASLAGWLAHGECRATTGQLPVHLADTSVARAR